MAGEAVTEKDRKLAAACMACPVCSRARRRQRGFCFWLVKRVEGKVCPACRAYEKVYGRKAHEAIEEKEKIK
ncbi:MAG: hypothetical protein JW709_05600 [Sedimentisphaerales bacterium]|nr:hypothetical protein [Sedimentisphaerales bacterium]